MVFSSIVFIGVFLPIFLIVYFFAPGTKLKNLVLVFFSLVFYAWGEPVWVLALLFSGSTDYVFGRIIGALPKGCRQAKLVLAVSIISNLGLLIVFKYSGFIAQNLNDVFGLSLAVPGFITLPIGISFYTFQTMSYTVDVYRGTVKSQKSYIGFLSYVTMFPQLLAGPIVRYTDIEPGISGRRMSLEGFSQGITRFAIGLGKKVILANAAGSVVVFLLDGNLERLSMASAWLGIIFYTFQIYFDFSGYSDMAIGMGKMIGYNYKENFNYPYVSKSITEFWRRWHISLSSFFRDFLYIPLGGNQRMYVRNMFIVWFLTGFWHGASWNFILWGIYFGVIITLERFIIIRILEKVPSVFGHIYSLFLIVVGWMLFYFTDFGRLGQFLNAAFRPENLSDFTFTSTLTSHLFLLLILIIAATPAPTALAKRLKEQIGPAGYLEPVFSAAVLLVCILLLVNATFNPFLYFRF